ncbi:GNAT family N-acetyltransferase [Endozoicomonas numazuensis]|uniref:GNAT family N-acetyltransferase n=1 Tax=Endozoicomonas numazuensis TaxID=1137799 RepID=UPI00068ADC83|nr:GNAT family N-acetyltransferase [Endozoicomonas numazuensis]
MNNKIELLPAEAANLNIIENLFPYYVYEMSDFLQRAPSEEGLFTFDRESLNKYQEREDHYPFLIKCNDEIAGFALVRKYPADPSLYDMEQFFVLKKFKGLGVGRLAFEALVDCFPGQWQIRVLQENERALAFWGAVVDGVTGGRFVRQVADDDGLGMWFFWFGGEGARNANNSHAAYSRQWTK